MANLKIIQDDNPESPREYDNLGTMVCWHNRYSLGDKQPRELPGDWFKDNVPPESVVLNLYLYDHSGITMSTQPFSCPWDSGQVGWIFVSPDKLGKEFEVGTVLNPGEKVQLEVEERAIEILKNEVKVYDQYLRGQCWGYEHGDDSCWGFIGDELEETGILDYLPEEARPLVEEAWEARA